MRRLHPVLRLIGAETDRDIDDGALLLWDLIVGPQMRGAALGLWPCAVTDETISIARQRIEFFLSARGKFPSKTPTTKARPAKFQDR
jgi:hypothetical protein